MMKSVLAASAALSAVLMLASPSVAAPASARDLSKSLVPGYPDVVAEYLQIPGFKAPGTPDALNTASFLRLRASADGAVGTSARLCGAIASSFALQDGRLAYGDSRVPLKHAKPLCALTKIRTAGRRRSSSTPRTATSDRCG